MGFYDEEERLEELQSVRKETAALDREEGARKRPAVTMMALVMVVWLVVLAADLAMGRSFTGATAVMLAAFAGLCWGTYRESLERSIGFYAVAAGAAALVFMVAHFMGI